MRVNYVAKCLMSPHSFSLFVSLDMSELPIPLFFHPSSPHLNFPVFFIPLLFLSLSHLPLILGYFIKTIKRKIKIKKELLLIVWLQIPQCHQVVHNIMTAFETVYCTHLYAHTQPEWWWICGVRKWRLTVKGCSEWNQRMWNRLLWWKRVKDREVGECWINETEE